MTFDRPVILASASPRRRELLERLVEEFEVIPANVDEESLTSHDPWETALALAGAKAAAVLAVRPGCLVIAGDTVVAYQPGPEEAYVQLAKPRDRDDAARMLRALSGRSHLVITGVQVVSDGFCESFAETTTVVFRELSDTEIEEYVQSGEPLDKAGAYAIQGGAKSFVASVTGSITNVIGLPVEKLAALLQSLETVTS